MANLAIKGHSTRGSEVIALLEMLGGKIRRGRLAGDELFSWYYINGNGYIDYKHYSLFNNTTCFTLEEFEEKFPYKVEDKVKNVRMNNFIGRIISAQWDYGEKQIVYSVEWDDVTKSKLNYFASGLKPYKEETMEKVKDNWAKWDLPDGYEFQDKDGNIINTSVIKLVKKQSKYPKTYDECCKMLGCKADDFFTDFSYNGRDVEISDYEDKIDDLLQNFRKLIYFRDAYWKIAGEQMGLGKPWEPDFDNENENEYKYGLFRLRNIIYKDATRINPTLLIFPTEEMRDAFYENFKELIENCKELL